MKRTIKSIAILLLTFALTACTGAIRTVEVTRVVPQTVVVTDAVQEGGFTTGTLIEVTTLPALKEVGGGGEPGPCFVDSTEPSISRGYGIFPHESLCLNNFPIAPDSPGFTVTLTDPIGRTFSETFTYQQEDIVNSTGANAGWIQEDSDSDVYPATPGVIINVYMPASFPCGNWSVSAKTQDGAINVGPTTLPVECSYSQISVLSDLNINPLTSHGYSWEGPKLANNETIYVVGAAYPPNTVVTVALYQVDPSAGKSEFGFNLGTAKYAVSVMTDGSGNFQAPFVVGSGTQRGAYYAVAAPVITTELKLYSFGARFSIEQ